MEDWFHSTVGRSQGWQRGDVSVTTNVLGSVRLDHSFIVYGEKDLLG